MKGGKDELALVGRRGGGGRGGRGRAWEGVFGRPRGEEGAVVISY